MTIYGELSDLHHVEDQQLKDGEAEMMISRTLGMFKQIYDIIKRIINYVTFLINQLNLLYNKKDNIHKNSMKNFNLFFPLDTIGRALSMIYVLDCVVE
jgi:WASH complex subunit 7